MMPLALRRIVLRPARFILLASSLFLITLLVGSVLLFQQALESTAHRLLGAGPSLVVSNVDAGGWAASPLQDAATIARIPGVASVQPRVWGVLPGPPAVTVFGTSKLPDNASDVIVGTGVPTAAVGQPLTLRALDGSPRTLRVREILSPNADIVAFDTVQVSLQAARGLLLLNDGDVTDFAVDTARSEENDAIAGEVAAAVAHPARAVTRAQMRGAYLAQAGQRGGVTFLVIVPSILALALIVAGVASGEAGARRDVGKLKLLGWTTRNVATLHLLEVGLVAFAGAGAGLVSAYAQVFLLGAGPLIALLLGWSDAPPNLTLDPTGTVLALLQIAALVFVPCAVAAIVPSWRLARTDPADLLEGP